MKTMLKDMMVSLSLLALVTAPLGCDPVEPEDADDEEFLEDELEDEDPALGAEARPDELAGEPDPEAFWDDGSGIPACGAFGPTNLYAGQSIHGCDNRLRLTMQADGNLVIYVNRTGIARWSTNTAGSGATLAAFQSDGNVVLYGPNGVVWASNTQWWSAQDCAFGLEAWSVGWPLWAWTFSSCGASIASGSFVP